MGTVHYRRYHIVLNVTLIPTVVSMVPLQEPKLELPTIYVWPSFFRAMVQGIKKTLKNPMAIYIYTYGTILRTSILSWILEFPYGFCVAQESDFRGRTDGLLHRGPGTRSKRSLPWFMDGVLGGRLWFMDGLW